MSSLPSRCLALRTSSPTILSVNYTQVSVVCNHQLSVVIPLSFMYLKPCLSCVLCGSMFYVTPLLFPCFLPSLFTVLYWVLDIEPCLSWLRFWITLIKLILLHFGFHLLSSVCGSWHLLDHKAQKENFTGYLPFIGLLYKYIWYDMMSCMFSLVEIVILPIHFQYIFVQTLGKPKLSSWASQRWFLSFVLFIHYPNKGRKEKALRVGQLYF